MYGPVGMAEVTLEEDPYALQGVARTFPSVLLSFGTTIIHGGWEERNEYGLNAGVVLQVIDISTGTPVVGQRIYREMNDLEGEGEYPYNWRQRAVKLDANRGVITWEGTNATWAMVFQVISGQITLGVPVNLGHILTIANPDVAEAYPTILDSLRDEELAALDADHFSYLGMARHYQTPGNAGTWFDRKVGGYVSVSGLTVTGVTWYWLNTGYTRFSSTFSSEGAGSMGLDGKTLAMWRYYDRNAVGNDTMTLVLITWAPFQVETRFLAEGYDQYGNFERNGSEIIWNSQSEYHLVSQEDPINGLITHVPRPDGSMYYPVAGSYFVGLTTETTVRGGFLVMDVGGGQGGGVLEGPIQLAEAIVCLTGAEHRAPASLDQVVPSNGEYYGATAILAGPRYAVLLVDYEVLVHPYNYREFLYVYEPVRQGDISPSDARVAFLQVRA